MKQIRNLFGVLLCAVILFCFAGCDVPVREEAEVLADFAASDFLTSKEGGRYQYTVESSEVTGRETNQKEQTDAVTVSAILKSKDGSVQVSGEYQVLYSQAEGAWVLDKVELVEETAVPLKESAFTEEDLLKALADLKDKELTDMTVSSQKPDLKNGKDTYTVTVNNHHDYTVDHLTISIDYSFDPQLGVWSFADYAVDKSSSELIPAKDEEIKKDFLASEFFKDYCLKNYSSDASYTLDKFEIEKRQTTLETKTDIVYASFTAVQEKGIKSLSGKCILNYVLYNDGWALDSGELKDVQVAALKASNVTEEALLEIVRQQLGYPNAENLKVYDRKTDLPQCTDVYCVTFEDKHTYMTEYFDVNMVYQLYQGNDWNYFDKIVNSTTEEWNICGNYYIDGELYSIYSFSNDTFEWETNAQFRPHGIQADSVIDARGISLENYIIDHMLRPSSHDYCTIYNYSVVIDDNRGSDICFICGTWLIGKDHIYFGFDDYNRTASDRKIHIELEDHELVPA